MDTRAELVTFLIAGVLEREGSLGRTKLVKLLYLLDVDQYSRYRRIATGFVWKYYFFGPYDARIAEVLERLAFDVPQERVTTSGGTQAITFKPTRIDDLLARVRLSDQIRRGADRILDRWALDDLNTILDHVYFHTEPMVAAKPGQELDFSSIPRYEPAKPPHKLAPIEPQTLRELRERMAIARTNHSKLEEFAGQQRRKLFSSVDDSYAALLRTTHQIEERDVDLDGARLVAPSWADEE